MMNGDIRPFECLSNASFSTASFGEMLTDIFEIGATPFSCNKNQNLWTAMYVWIIGNRLPDEMLHLPDGRISMLHKETKVDPHKFTGLSDIRRQLKLAPRYVGYLFQT